MNNTLWILLGCAAVIIFIVLARRRARCVTITFPKLGFFNLKGPSAHTALTEDRKALVGIFGTTQDGTIDPPRCDVLFIYCDIANDGRISGTNFKLREMIRDSGARVAVVATENPDASYVAAAENTGYGHANIVLTLQRNGPAFPEFFSTLFNKMKNGTPMPLAWTELAPQNPQAQHNGAPSTICLLETGQILFK